MKIEDMRELTYGAKWWEFDFHNQTPAPNDFGSGDVKKMKAKDSVG